MLSVTPAPKVFAVTSLIMIVAMVIAAGLTQAPFFRQAMIERESMLVRDMVNALALEHGLSAFDLEHYTEAAAQRQLERSFHSLRKLRGIRRIKVFNRDNTIVWSDAPDLVGTKRTAHLDDLTQAMQGEVRAVFNPARTSNKIVDRGPPNPESIEIYAPIDLSAEASPPAPAVIGVLALYRAPHQLNETIREDLYLLWAVIGVFGAVLFVALYKLFVMVYSRQKIAESKFSKLTSEHERIVQIEKLSAMGELVGEIAHQLNNPLVGVINLTQLAEREVNDPRRVAELLAEVRKAGSECRDIVQRILRINQISRSEPQTADIKNLVADTVAFCRQSLGSDHAIDFEAPEPAVMLNVDPILIRHALFNLIHNAILAAPEQPVKITLAAAEHDGMPGYLLAVIDRGNGFDGDIAARLFKPFFTTRADGTGLGLAVAQHVVTKHGGTLRAENLPAGGARFSIWLPAITTL